MMSAAVSSRTRWVYEEEEALIKGVAKHGRGRWMRILSDPEFSEILKLRTNVNLKDKWRSIGALYPQGPPKPSDKERVAALNRKDGSGSDSESSPEPEQLPKSRFDVSLDAFKKLLQQEEEESIEEEEDEEAGELPPDVLELSIEEAQKRLSKLNDDLDDVAQKKASLRLTVDRKGAAWVNSTKFKEANRICNEAEKNLVEARDLLQKRIDMGIASKSPISKKKSKESESSHQKTTKKHYAKRTKNSSPERASKRETRKRARGNAATSSEAEAKTDDRVTKTRASSSKK